LRQGANRVWVHPKWVDVLKECGMQTIVEYIHKQRDTIAVYLVTQPILEACREGKQQRGLMSRQWWWEQLMSFDVVDALGSDAESNSVSSLTD
jgi:hypothetical protein